MLKQILMAAGCGVLVLSAQNSPPAVYTAAQAAAGRTAYESTCARCHTDKLTGRDGTGDIPEIARPFKGKIPPLAGKNAAFPPFLTKWGPRTTKALSARIHDAVGGFPPKEMGEKTYLDITAYVLQVNAAPSGSQDLTADTEVVISTITHE